MLNIKKIDVSMLHTFIKEGVRKEVEAEYDFLKADLLKRLEERKNEICAGIVLQTMKFVNMQQLNDTFVIQIKELPKN